MPQRVMRSDEEKKTLIAEYDALPPEARVPWLQEKGLNASWFRRMRKGFGSPKKKRSKLSPEGIEAIRKAQRERWQRQKVAGIPHLKKDSASSFREASNEEKRRLLAEYDNLPFSERAAWKAVYGADDRAASALMTYYRTKFRAEDKRRKPSVKLAAPSTAVVPYSANNQPSMRDLFNEYNAQPNGTRGQWLKDHGLYASWPQHARGVLRREAPIPAPAPAHILPAAAPTAVVTLDDAISALQVRQDIFNEFIGLLKAMRGGAR